MIRLSVSQKIAAGYLLVVVFCLTAIIYALTVLGDLTRRSEQLVVREFGAVVLARDLSQALWDQERLEKQVLILKDASMIPLIDARQQSVDTLMERLRALSLGQRLDAVEQRFASLEAAQSEARALLDEGLWQRAERHSAEVVTPLHEETVDSLEAFRQRREALMDQMLHDFSDRSGNAYRLTLLLAAVGIGLAALVVTAVILKMQRALARLTEATRVIASGRFNHAVGLEGEDEFGRLARDFSEMENKLNELQRLNLDANPLTRLPGNLAIDRELENRIASDRPFAHIYIDLDYFKAYNDRYGYLSGSEIIARVGSMIKDVAARLGNAEDLIGHIGGDDYVVLSTPDRAEAISAALIREFDAMVPGFYSEQDRVAGFFKGLDRYGVERQFPLLSMSIAIVCSDNLRNPSAEAIGRECAKMKEYLKKLPGSNYLLDRREKR